MKKEFETVLSLAESYSAAKALCPPLEISVEDNQKYERQRRAARPVLLGSSLRARYRIT